MSASYRIRRRRDGLYLGDVVIPVPGGHAITTTSAAYTPSAALHRAASLAERAAADPAIQMLLPAGAVLAPAAIKAGTHAVKAGGRALRRLFGGGKGKKNAQKVARRVAELEQRVLRLERGR